MRMPKTVRLGNVLTLPGSHEQFISSSGDSHKQLSPYHSQEQSLRDPNTMKIKPVLSKHERMYGQKISSYSTTNQGSKPSTIDRNLGHTSNSTNPVNFYSQHIQHQVQ
jgi:hypothetical protein